MEPMIDIGETDTSAMWTVKARTLATLYERSNVAFPFQGDQREYRPKPAILTAPPMPRQHCNNCGITHDA